MKVCTLIFCVLLACVASLASERGPLLSILHPLEEASLEEVPREEVALEPVGPLRQKRSLLLGAGALGVGALGLGAAGLVGAGLIGAKAGFIGGALAGGALSHGRSYGGYGGYYRPSYGYGYGGGYRSYYPSRTYVVSDPWC